MPTTNWAVEADHVVKTFTQRKAGEAAAFKALERRGRKPSGLGQR